MQTKVLVLLAILAIASVSAEDEFERFLVSSSDPSVYGDNVTIAFSWDLGCGACIRSGYVFCTQGGEG